MQQNEQLNQEKVPLRRKAALLWRFLKGSKGFFVVSMLTTALAALMDMLTPQIVRMAVDNVVGNTNATYADWIMALVNKVGGFAYLRQNLWILAVAVALVALVKVIAQYAFRLSNTMGTETLVKTMRDTLFGHIEHLPFSWHMQNRTGDIIQRCTSDIDTARNFVSEQMTNLLRILILLVLSMIFMMGMNVPLTLIALAPMPVIILYSVLFHNRLHKGFQACDESEGKLSAMAQENLTGVRVVRAFGRERYEKDRFENHNEEYTGLWIKLGRLMSSFWASSDVLSGIQVMLVVIFGAVMCVNGKMTAGSYIAFLSYNGMLVWPIRQLGRMISEMSKAGVAVDRIGYIMNSEKEKDRDNAVEPDMTGDIAFEQENTDFLDYDVIIDEENGRYSDYERIELFTMQLCLKCSADHPLCNKALYLNQLCKQPFILMDTNGNMNRILVEACNRAGFHPQISVVCNDIECYEKFLKCNMGIGIGRQSENLAETISGVVDLEVCDFKQRYTLYAYYVEKEYYGNVKNFVEFIKNKGN